MSPLRSLGMYVCVCVCVCVFCPYKQSPNTRLFPWHMLTISSLCIMSICNFSYFPFCFFRAGFGF